MSESIINNKRECIVCKTIDNLHRHHVFEGTGRRKLSEQYGCWVYLCSRHHNGSNAGVHFNKRFDAQLKKMCQIAWEERYGTTEDFIRIFGRNYR